MFKKIIDLNKFSGLLLYTSILTFIIAFNFSDNPPSGWYQQFLPNLNGRPISDITFLDSLTGYAVTPNTPNDTAYIIKTTTGGNNWFIIKKQQTNIEGGFNTVQFINLNTGFAAGNFLYKTTNAGSNWFQINTPSISNDIFALNDDTIWLADEQPTAGGLFRTTNGGISWDRQFNKAGSGNPSKVYFYNRDIGFITGGSFLWKTTDSGLSWNELPGAGGFHDIFFKDSLIGYKTFLEINNPHMQKTMNGGLNWYDQTLPYGGYILPGSGIAAISNVGSDTIWGVGGTAFYGSGGYRGLIYRTTNGGTNWLYQIPDTSIAIGAYGFVQFVNKNLGWAYNSDPAGIHTSRGGDSIFTKIKNSNSIISGSYLLYQNYPNPFNPNTIINYQLSMFNYVSLKVYDVLGNEVKTLVNGKKNTGSYSVNFDGSNLSSGIYFYSLFIDGKRVATKRMVLVR